MLNINNLSKTYHKETILRNVSFSLASGELLLIGGDNGAGKSTLLRIIAGLTPPDTGTITLNGQPVSNRKALAGQIAYVPQEPSFHMRLTVAENLSFWSSINGLSGKKQQEYISNITELLSLEPVLKKKAARLSGGMKKRLNFAISLFSPCKLLLLDEPFANVDASTIQVLTRIIKGKQRSGCAILLVSHTDETNRFESFLRCEINNSTLHFPDMAEEL